MKKLQRAKQSQVGFVAKKKSSKSLDECLFSFDQSEIKSQADKSAADDENDDQIDFLRVNGSQTLIERILHENRVRFSFCGRNEENLIFRSEKSRRRSENLRSA